MTIKRERCSRGRRRTPFSFSPFGRSMCHATHISSTRNEGVNNSRFGKESKPLLKSSPPIRVVRHEDPSECSDDEIDGVIVNADFAFFDPRPEDFGGVQNLLQSYLIGEQQWDLSGFVDLVLAQTTVGTVVRVEGEEDGVFGLVTALNLGRYKNNKSILEIKEYLLSVCFDEDILEHMRGLLGDQDASVGLLVSQRVTNFPPQLIPHLYDSIFDEISWATEDEPEELRKYFHFKYFVISSRIYKKKGSKGHCDDDTVIYVKPEDEIFIKLSTWHFNFPLKRQMHLGFDGFHLTGLVMVVEMSKVFYFRRDLKSLVDEC